jgi:hypothetical protein
MEARRVFFETALAVTANPETWQGTADSNSLYVLIASLVLALIAFVILMRDSRARLVQVESSEQNLF